MYEMVADSNSTAARKSLDVIMDLYRRKVGDAGAGQLFLP